MSDPRVYRCVECGNAGLEQGAGKHVCPSCGREYPLHSHRELPVFVSSRSPLVVDEVMQQRVVPQEVDLEVAKRHWKTGRLAELLPNESPAKLLNFGSGDGGDRQWLESLGFEVTAFDIYPSDFVECICDGHELPFLDESFDVVTSTAVYEHLYNPFQAAREMYRVLKPGGTCLGSAAFLEGYHAFSYFHMSHLGLTEIFKRAGFRDITIYPGWSAVESMSKFWVWNKVGPIKRITRKVNRLRFHFGMALWKLAYKLKSKPLPDDIRLGFCGSLQFKVIK